MSRSHIIEARSIIGAGSVGRDGIMAQALSDSRRHNPLGHQIHTVLAMTFLFTLPLAPAPQSIAFALLFGCALVRLRHTWQSYWFMLRTPSLVLLLLWCAWCATTMLWSSDVKQGGDEFGAQRMLLIPVLIWPVLDRLPWLIGAALLGVLAQNVAQLFQALDWINVRTKEGEGRYGGLMHPIKTGAWCAAAMCWHTSAMLRARGVWRIAAIIGCAIATCGLIATEARGAWLGAAVAVPAMLLLTAIRRRELRRAITIVAGTGLIAAAAAWPLVGLRIIKRIQDAVEQVQRANDEGVYWTSVGLRVGMMKWSWSIFQQHKIAGVGLGGYPSAQQGEPDYKAGLARAHSSHQREYMTKAHPHSIYLYTLACTGIIGGLILLAVIVLALRQCWIDPPAHLYADGAFFVLISWLIGAQFDCYNLDGPRLGLLALTIAATLPGRAAVRFALAAIDPADTNQIDNTAAELATADFQPKSARGMASS